jgi:lipoprotein-anchoring transpeptidase ErfK/SrfK
MHSGVPGAGQSRVIRSGSFILAVVLVFSLVVACGDSPPPEPTAEPSATLTPIPSSTPTPRPSPTATPPPTPMPQLSVGGAVVVGGVVRTRADPSTTSEHIGTVADRQELQIVEKVQGENWLVGSQTWVATPASWTRDWYRLADGSYVYGAFVFVLGEGEVSPMTPAPPGQEKWIDVNLSTQRARAMIGDRSVFETPISSGEPAFPSKVGSFAIEPDGRLAVERMTSSQAGYQASQTQYDVERVLFTQYFDREGNALHLNYWRPSSVFGRTPTSHGCIGIELHGAQYFWLFATAGTRVEIHN